MKNQNNNDSAINARLEEAVKKFFAYREHRDALENLDENFAVWSRDDRLMNFWRDVAYVEFASQGAVHKTMTSFDGRAFKKFDTFDASVEFTRFLEGSPDTQPNDIINTLSNEEVDLLISMRDQYQTNMDAVLKNPGCGGDIPKSHPVVESKIAVLNKVIDIHISGNDVPTICESDDNCIDTQIVLDEARADDPEAFARKQRVELHHLVRCSFQGREITGEVTHIGRVAAIADHSVFNTLLTMTVDDDKRIDDEPYHLVRESEVEIFGGVPQYINS